MFKKEVFIIIKTINTDLNKESILLTSFAFLADSSTSSVSVIIKDLRDKSLKV